MKCLILVLFSVLISVTGFGNKKYKLVEIETNMGTIKVKLYEDTPNHSENFLKLAKEKHYDSLLFHRVIKDFMIQGGSSDSKKAAKGQRVGASEPEYTLEAEISPEHHHFKGALAAARQGDHVNPEKRSSGEQFYMVHGRTYTDAELDQIEKKKLATAMNKVGDELYKEVKAEHQRYLRTGQRQKADSIIRDINTKIKKQFDGENPYAFTSEVRGLYKSVGGAPFLDGDYTVFGEVVEGMDIIDKIAAVKTDRNDRPEEDVVILSTKLKRK